MVLGYVECWGVDEVVVEEREGLRRTWTGLTLLMTRCSRDFQRGLRWREPSEEASSWRQRYDEVSSVRAQCTRTDAGEPR